MRPAMLSLIVAALLLALPGAALSAETTRDAEQAVRERRFEDAVQIWHALAERGVNVEELETECESAPMSGEILFKAHATLHAPENVDLDALRADLEAIAQDLMVELSLVRPL